MKTKTNRVISLCLILALASAVVPLLVSAAKTPLLPGDLNRDGVVHSDDARIALRAAARIIPLTDIILANGDIDGNGKITSADARRILRAAAKIEALPAGSDQGEAQTTAEPVTAEPVTAEPVTAEPVTAEPATAESVTAEPVTAEPVTAKPATEEPVTEEPVTEEPLTVLFPDADLNTAYHSFAAALLKNEYKDGKNILLSPLSVMTALAMTENGAKNRTLRQMETMFGLDVDSMREQLCAYLQQLPQTEKCKLIAANSVWLKKDGFSVLSEDFIDINRRCYNAEIREDPFDEKTVEAVNDWCRKNTDGMIEKIIDKLPDNAVMLLINALTFDAEWATIYTTEEVHGGEFTNADGSKSEIEMMYSEESSLIETDTLTGFIKPYAGNNYSFVALLPKEGTTVSELIASLDGKTVPVLLSGAESASVTAAIPKFQSEYSCSLIETLKKMGMTDAFSAAADLTGIGVGRGGNLFVSEVIHKTFISVDERGTRAGAVTLVAVSDKAVFMTRYVILDRPFVYMIVDNAANLPIFIGAVNAL